MIIKKTAPGYLRGGSLTWVRVLLADLRKKHARFAFFVDDYDLGLGTCTFSSGVHKRRLVLFFAHRAFDHLTFLAEFQSGLLILDVDDGHGVRDLADEGDFVAGLQAVEIAFIHGRRCWPAFPCRKRKGCRGKSDEGEGGGEDGFDGFHWL